MSSWILFCELDMNGKLFREGKAVKEGNSCEVAYSSADSFATWLYSGHLFVSLHLYENVLFLEIPKDN